jgi:uncharacterized membrane protein
MDALRKGTREFRSKLVKRLPWRQILVGLVMVLSIAWWMYTPEGLLGKADAVGYAVCHRIDARSFHLGERQIPVCARCTGQYLGAMLGLVYLSLFRSKRSGRPGWGVIGILIGFVLAYGIDGVNSYLHLIPGLSRFYIYEPSNFLRLITGTGLGLGISIMLYPAFNETVWKVRDRRPVIEGTHDFIFLLLLGGLVDILVLTGNPWILYPFALISAGGVLVLLTLVYTMVTVMIIKKEKCFDDVKTLVYPLIAGFIVTIIQISLLDTIRYFITGSWNGFHFG